MQSPILDLPATPGRLQALASTGQISEAALDRAIAMLSATPRAAAWRSFISRALLFLGATLVLSGVVFFFAYNWAALGRFAKFGLIEALLLACALGAWRIGLDRVAGQASLAAAAVLVGPLLAVFGQTYQTGADPFELFLGWAALIAPWVVIARFAPLMLIFVGLLDTALGLYFSQVMDRHESEPLLLMLATLHGAAWLLFELGGRRGIAWLKPRWSPRALALGVLAPLLLLTLGAILGSGSHEFSPVGPVLLVVLIAGMLRWFSREGYDLFMLSAALGTAITATTTFLGRSMRGLDGISLFFLLGTALVIQVGAAAYFLRITRQQRLDRNDE